MTILDTLPLLGMSKTPEAPVRLLICGDRYWENFKPIKELVDMMPAHTLLIEGGAKGADLLAQHAGRMRNWNLYTFRQRVDYHWHKTTKELICDNNLLLWREGPAIWEFPANWDYPQMKSGGPIRNSAMLSIGDPLAVVGFHNNLASSKGTKDMLRKALAKGIVTSLYSDRQGMQVLTRNDPRLKR